MASCCFCFSPSSKVPIRAVCDLKGDVVPLRLLGSLEVEVGDVEHRSYRDVRDWPPVSLQVAASSSKAWQGRSTKPYVKYSFLVDIPTDVNYVTYKLNRLQHLTCRHVVNNVLVNTKTSPQYQ